MPQALFPWIQGPRLPFEILAYDAYSGWDLVTRHLDEDEARKDCEALAANGTPVALTGPGGLYEHFGPSEESVQHSAWLARCPH